ncbi:MAG: type II toxin-antitoxin system VapC family toxin [Acidobacteria bacterium]|nr:type II toxin-antitoxin system VapC family toxin [Acidobacteriota bacterium]
MNFFWLDASALVKRYVPEIGTPSINHLFNQTSARFLICLLEGIGETVSILVRRKNQGVLTPTAFRQVLSELRSEISQNADIEKVYQTRAQVISSWQWIERHSLNSTDSIILQCAFDKADEFRADGHDLVLVSADARLIRAASAAGIMAFNPETDAQAGLDALL